jgi:hypothetical protein
LKWDDPRRTLDRGYYWKGLTVSLYQSACDPPHAGKDLEMRPHWAALRTWQFKEGSHGWRANINHNQWHHIVPAKQ